MHVVKTASPEFKRYREADGKFYFKLEDGDGAVLLQSRAFDSPKDAGRITAALIDAGDDASAVSALLIESVASGEQPAEAPITAALAQLKAEKLAKERDKKG
jgi:tryptophanyl-tRNA synthetase